MVTAAKLDRNAYYDEPGLCETMGLRRGSLQRARMAGTLRFTRQGGRILFRGDWVEDWLTGAERDEPVGSASA